MRNIIREREMMVETFIVNGETVERVYFEPAVMRCDCGAEITLSNGMTNGCDRCDREYNGSGQLLASREFWGEETGETVGDILNGRDADW
jgi:hypothetical protein